MKWNKISPIRKYSCMDKYPKNLRIVRDLLNSLFIHKIFANSKIIIHFKKRSLNQQNHKFQIFFHQFPKNIRRY